MTKGCLQLLPRDFSNIRLSEVCCPGNCERHRCRLTAGNDSKRKVVVAGVWVLSWSSAAGGAGQADMLGCVHQADQGGRL